jgi:hypothetical protein
MRTYHILPIETKSIQQAITAAVKVRSRQVITILSFIYFGVGKYIDKSHMASTPIITPKSTGVEIQREISLSGIISNQTAKKKITSNKIARKAISHTLNGNFLFSFCIGKNLLTLFLAS